METQETASLGSLNLNDDEENENSFQEENGVLFYVNRDGFPMSTKNWERMWRHVEKIHPENLKMVQKIRDNPNLEKIPMAVPPTLTSTMLIQEKLKLLQDYLIQLHLMDTAREIIKESLPIKCLEAVIVSLYLTSSFSELQRFTISFKSQFSSHFYRHIVLGVAAYGKYGSLGLSRRDNLMYKPIEFKSLSDLINNFITSYKTYDHTVKKIKLSLPIVHDLHSCEKIYWKYLVFNPNKMSDSDMKKLLDKFAREVRHSVKMELNNITFFS
ncbi:hypothetical protein QZH41_013467 [Actinostola sp. cb2023]|nr:hypothetical protein QZH41_013467 [Actinostola sp. cb2023]